MVNVGSLFALWSVVSVSTATADDGPIIRHDGDPVGREEVYNGSMYAQSAQQSPGPLTKVVVNLYITGDKTSDTAVLYLTDVFGIQLLENRLLVAPGINELSARAHLTKTEPGLRIVSAARATWQSPRTCLTASPPLPISTTPTSTQRSSYWTTRPR